MFARLPDKPDHDALERAILELWEREQTFSRLREQNAAGPRFSFVDGPVTANRMALAVHTAWGRTLKDVFQRYKALRGHHQRYQNGFDCQGLWIEVGVERQLGLNSKREIEEYGLAEFARRCREVVVQSSKALTDGSIRLGQWMDWGNDYFTFSDTNIEYIWRFLKLMHERGRVYMGHRSTEWCPRCGTSLSQHELTQSGVYQDRADPSLTVRFPLVDRPGQSLVIWTTTPWTLPANVAAAVHPEARVRQARERRVGDGGALPRRDLRGGRAGIGRSSASATRVRSTRSRRERRSSIASSPGTRSRSTRARGSSTSPRAAAARTSSCRASTTCPSSRPSTRRGASTTTTAGCTACRPATRPTRSSATWPSAGCSCMPASTSTATRTAGAATRRSSSASPTTGSSPSRSSASRSSTRTRPSSGRLRTWASAWTTGCGTWATGTSRAVATTACRCRSTPARAGSSTWSGRRRSCSSAPPARVDELEELRRPWVDAIRIRCEACGDEVERIAEVGDVWLDAGIVPFSTLGWESPEYVPEGYATGAARGLTRADLPDHAYLGGVVPRGLGLGDARADPALVLLAALHVGGAHRQRAVPPGARLREDARRDGPRDAQLVGQHDRRAGRVRAHGRRRDALAVLRAAARPEPALRVRAGARDPAQAAPALALGHVPRAVRQRRVVHAALRRPRRGGRGNRAARPLACTAHAPARGGGDRCLRALVDSRRDPCVRGVRRRPLELVHPLLPAAVLGGRRDGAPRALARDRPVAAGDRAGPALPVGAPLAGARP